MRESTHLAEVVYGLGTGQRKEAILNVGGGSPDGLERIRLIRERAEEGFYMELEMDMSDFESLL